MLALPHALPLLPLALAACSTRPELTLNELMADNESTVADGETGEYLDWIELYNPGAEPVSLEGFSLTDALDDPTREPLSDRLVIEAGGFLLLWADEDTGTGPTHLGFSLSKEGEEVGLFWSDPETGNLLQLDAVAFGAQEPDISWARTADGDGAWGACTDPSPGSSNP